MALIFGSASTASAQEWTKFAPDAGRFEVMLPGTPQASTETKDSENGPFTTTLFILRTSEVTFLIGYVDYDPKFNFNVRSEINANRDNFMKGFKEGKLLAEKEITFEANPGLEFIADLTSTSFVTSRIFVVGRRPYQLVAITAKGADQAGVVKFLDSFKLTSK